MRYLITGATGFLGGELVRQLLAAGNDVTALVRSPARARHLLDAGVRLYEGDVTDPTSVAPAVVGQNGVFHLAAWYHVGQRNAEAETINVEGTRNVLTTSWQAGVERILYTSSLAINSDTGGRILTEGYRFDGRHLSEYDRTKWRAHFEVAQPLTDAGAPVVIVQPGVIYGAGDDSGIGRLFRAWLQGRSPAFCPTAAYCWGHVEDTAAGLVAAMERGRVGQSYILAGPGHTLEDAFQLGAEITGISPPRRAVPAALLKTAAPLVAALGLIAPPLAGAAELLRVGSASYLGDSSKARDEFGFHTRTLKQGFTEWLPRIVKGEA